MKLFFWKFGWLFLSSSLAYAGGSGVSFDGSMGPKATLTGPNYIIPANMGTQRGGNLFHSFSQFDLASHDVATFTATGSTGAINNILARVTSGSASSIDGTIASTISGANLFLLNPAGIMFGPDAHVDIGGSFITGTPDYVKLTDGGKFNTSLGGDDVLTSAPVSAFGFVHATPQPVSFAGTQIAMQPGTGLHVIGGDVTVDQGTPASGTQQGSQLAAPSGALTVFSAASPGEVPFSLASPGSGFALATNPSFGNITIQHGSSLAIDSALGGGKAVMRGGHLVIDNSAVSSVNSGPNPGGDISVQADVLTLQNGGQIGCSTTSAGNSGNLTLNTGSLSITSGSYIYNETSSSGNAGALSVTASSLDIDGSATPNSFTAITNETTGSGNGGPVSVDVSQALTLEGGGQIGDSTFYSSGNAGTLTLHAGSLTINGSAATGDFTGVGSNTASGATGNAGDLNLTIEGTLSIQGSGQISSSSYSSGKAGNLTVNAASLNIDGSATPSYVTHIASDAYAQGTGGNVTLNVTGTISLLSGGQITSDTTSTGNAGDLSVTAEDITINPIGLNVFTGISDSSEPGATGNGGALNIQVADNLNLIGGGEITASTSSSGQGGSITLHAGSLSMNGTSNFYAFTGISDQSGVSTGNAGDLSVVVDGAINIDDGGISGSSFSAGRGGDVSVQAGTIDIDNGQISSSAHSTGNAGNISVTAGPILLTDGGQITANSERAGNGGNISVQADSLQIQGYSATSATFTPTGILGASAVDSTGDAGNINVQIKNAITISGFGGIDSSTFGTGSGGQVYVHAGSLSFVGAPIPVSKINIGSALTGISSSSFAPGSGAAGSVTVDIDNALTISGYGTGLATLTNTSGTGGDLKVTAGTITILGIGLPNELTGISAQATSSGNAGNITVTTGSLSMGGGGEIASLNSGTGLGGNVMINAGNISLNGLSTISASAFANDAGTIQIEAGTLSISSDGSISTSSGATGGNIEISAGSLVYLLNGQITSAAFGNGGNITIDPQFVVLNNSLISANSEARDGGRILITADNFLNSNSLITATGGISNGSVTITAPNLNLAGGLVVLSGSLVDTAMQLQESCTQAVLGDFSSFTVSGKDGSPLEPNELQIDLPSGPSSTYQRE